MKALSLTPPFASLIALGAKRVETRTGRFPRSFTGQFAVHQTIGLQGLQQMLPGRKGTRPEQLLNELCSTSPFACALEPLRRRAAGQQDTLLPGHDVDWNRVLPRGAVVAVAHVQGIEDITATLAAQIRAGRVTGYGTVGVDEHVFGDYRPGRVAIFINHVTPLIQPVACPGQQGVWDLPAHIDAQVRHALHLAFEHEAAPRGLDDEPEQLPAAVGSFRTHTPPFAIAAGGVREGTLASGGAA
ncbi:MAG TPA: hypothetical protein VFZ00_01540 [Solirubrobacter sp.]|nr:hypothetical protein [Solirubrobacter sp.]